MTNPNDSGNEMITCRSCGHTEPLTKKFKCSNCGAKNWGFAGPAKHKGCLTEIIIGLIFLASVAGYNAWKDYRNAHWSLEKTAEKLSDNIVIVYHEYVYELQFDDPKEGSLYFVKEEDGRFSQWQKGMQPNTIIGCGLLRDRDGKCVSTKKICRPWFDDWDIIGLKRAVQVFPQEPFNIRSGGNYKIFTVKLGYYIPGKKINEPNSFIPCNVSGGWAEGITELSPVAAFKTENDITAFNVNNAAAVNPGDKIYLFSYAMPINKVDPLKPLEAEGTISALHRPSLESWEFSYSVPGLYPMEGSPVFNEAADVVGITSFDSSGILRAIGFNMERFGKHR